MIHYFATVIRIGDDNDQHIQQRFNHRILLNADLTKLRISEIVQHFDRLKKQTVSIRLEKGKGRESRKIHRNHPYSNKIRL